MEFQVLGPIRVIRQGSPIYIGTARMPQLLLAVLLVRQGQPVDTDCLIENLWGNSPPRSARRNLHQYIHKLRSLLGADVLDSANAGYMLLTDMQVDMVQFFNLADHGSAAIRAGEYSAAARLLREALSLWRGEPFQGFREVPVIDVVVAKLERARLVVIEQLAEAEIELGQPGSVTELLAETAEAHPFSERIQALLMRSLYLTGQQASALGVYQRTREVLVEQLGVEPSSELQQAHLAILQGPRVDESGAPSGHIPRELPAPVNGFTGQAEAMGELDAMLRLNQEGPSSVVITAISGMAGVGKTALATHWGHRVADKFPDGQLYINLNGYADSEPVTSLQALSALLGSLGVPLKEIPVEVNAAAARYRTLVAGKRILIVLDNARSAAQVRPLLPAGSGCLAVITSRDRLSSLVAQEGIRRLTISPLSMTEAVDLLGNLLGHERVEAERTAAQELARICDYLPLALRIAAARLADDAHARIANYVSALSSQNAVTALVAGDSAVRTAFQLSYEALDEHAQVVFRRLGLLPLKDFTAPTVARLAGLDEPSAADALNSLAGAHLVNQYQPGRFSIHDLLRGFAKSVSDTEDSKTDRERAKNQLLDWYSASVHAAATRHYPDFVRTPTAMHRWSYDPFQDPAEALTWLNSERHNLNAAIRFAIRHGPATEVWLLVDGLRGYYDQQRHGTEYLDMCRGAVAVARSVGSEEGLSAALLALAQACFGVSRYRSSLRYLHLAAATCKRIGWSVGEAASSANLGILLDMAGRTPEAIDWLNHGLELYRAMANAPGQARTTISLATVHGGLGNIREAIALAEEGYEIFKAVGSAIGQAQAKATTAELLLLTGRYQIARGLLQTAMDLSDSGQKYARSALYRILLAQAELGIGDAGRSRKLAEAALRLAVRIRDNYLTARAISAVAAAVAAEGNDQQARELYKLSMARATELKAHSLICEAHLGLASISLVRGEFDGAQFHGTQSLVISEQLGLKVALGKSLNLLAQIQVDCGDCERAAELALRALEIHQSTGHQPGEDVASALLAEIRQGAQKAKATG